MPIQVTQIAGSAVHRTGETLDISSSGVLFECVSEIAPGERIEYIITLAAPQVKLRCLGKVLRIAKQSAAPDAPSFEVAVTIDRYHFIRAARMETAGAIA